MVTSDHVVNHSSVDGSTPFRFRYQYRYSKILVMTYEKLRNNQMSIK